MKLQRHVGQKIKFFRERDQMTQEELAKKLGTTPQSISRYEQGLRKANQDVLFSLSKIFKVRIDDFFPDKSFDLNTKKIYLEGSTAANPSNLFYNADPMYDEIATVNVPLRADGALVVRGDSMENMYKDGDIAFYRSQPSVDSGDIAIIEINGDGTTMKKFIPDYDNYKVILRSLNKKYKDRVVDTDKVRIIGKVIQY